MQPWSYSPSLMPWRSALAGVRGDHSSRVVADSSDLSAGRSGEREVRHPARRGGRLDLVVLLESFQAIPQPDAPAEEDGHDHDMQLVDEPGRRERADRRRV